MFQQVTSWTLINDTYRARLECGHLHPYKRIKPTQELAMNCVSCDNRSTTHNLHRVEHPNQRQQPASQEDK
jgi:hypothetical protein